MGMLDTVKSCLKKNGLRIEKETRLANNTGSQLRLDDGAIVNVYDKGSWFCQGKNSEAVKKLLENDLGLGQQKQVSDKIFVVYGHDETAKRDLEAMLRRWKLDPLFLDQLPSQGQTIIEKLERYSDETLVSYAIVLATPDDEGHRRDFPDEKANRVRQNVALELGMMLAKLGRSNVAILLKQEVSMEKPSDIQGLIYIPFKDNLQKQAGPLLAKEMASQGFNIDVSNL